MENFIKINTNLEPTSSNRFSTLWFCGKITGAAAFRGIAEDTVGDGATGGIAEIP